MKVGAAVVVMLQVSADQQADIADAINRVDLERVAHWKFTVPIKADERE